MNISYRYLTIDKALEELASVKSGDVNIFEALDKEGFHSRPFVDEKITNERLLEVRSTFMEAIGAKSGDVKDIKVKGPDFDRTFTKLSQTLFFDMSPIDGFNRDVWSYINLRLLPDLAMWRWQKRENTEEATDSRLLGGAERSCFQRLWLRAYVIGPELAGQLLEDEAVNIFERPEALGGNRRLSLAMANYIVQNRGELDPKSGKLMINTQVVKQSAKRLRRAMAVQVVQTMSDSEINSFVKNTFQETLRNSITEKTKKAK